MAAGRGHLGRRRQAAAGPVNLRALALFLLAPLAAAQQPSDLKGYQDAVARGDYNAAAAELRQPADAGNPEAQYHYAMLYAKGLGLRPSEALAASWMRRSADQGYAEAQYELGRMYAAGRGVPPDRREAIGWLKKAAAGGHAPAAVLLRQMGAAD